MENLEAMTLANARLICDQADAVRAAFGWDDAPMSGSTGLLVEVGDPYPRGPVFIRTVTHYLVGRIVEVFPTELVIEDAAWVASTGRFHEAMSKGVLDEVEPFPSGRVVVGRGAIIDCIAWTGDLPLTVQ